MPRWIGPGDHPIQDLVYSEEAIAARVRVTGGPHSSETYRGSEGPAALGLPEGVLHLPGGSRADLSPDLLQVDFSWRRATAQVPRARQCTACSTSGRGSRTPSESLVGTLWTVGPPFEQAHPPPGDRVPGVWRSVLCSQAAPTLERGTQLGGVRLRPQEFLVGTAWIMPKTSGTSPSSRPLSAPSRGRRMVRP